MIKPLFIGDVSKLVVYLPWCKKVFSKMENNTRKTFSAEDVSMLIIRDTEDEGKIILYGEAIPIFTTHPKEFHDVDYPFSSDSRGLLSVELEYQPASDKETTIEAGNCYWHGTDSTLSWRGSPGFHIEVDNSKIQEEISREDMQNLSTIIPKYTSFGPHVYENGNIIWGIDVDENDTEAPQVIGACYFENILIVLTRIYNGEHFILQAYANDKVIGELQVGRFNTIWSFKKDGSAGVAYTEGNLYRCYISKTVCIFDEPIYVNTNLKMPMDITIIDENTTTMTNPNAVESDIYPKTVATMNHSAKTDWMAIKNRETINTINYNTSASGIDEYIIGYSYDESDNEVPLIAELNLTIDHNYEKIVYQKNDAMLVMPENSTGLVVNGDCGQPEENDDCLAVQFKNCSGGYYTVAGYLGDSLSFSASSTPLAVGGTVTVSGGRPPYNIQVVGGSTSGSVSGATYTRGACAVNDPAWVSLQVSDICGTTIGGTFIFPSGSWKLISTSSITTVGSPVSGYSTGWTSRYVSGEVIQCASWTGPSPLTTGSPLMVETLAQSLYNVYPNHAQCLLYDTCVDTEMLAITFGCPAPIGECCNDVTQVRKTVGFNYYTRRWEWRC